MKFLLFDIETSTISVKYDTYELRTKRGYLNPNVIKRDWIILGAAWKYLGDDTINCISVSPKSPLNDYGVVKTLHKILSEADVVCGHNSDKFDIKKINTRFLYYDLPPIGKKLQIDTLKLAKRYFSITSNSLSYIADFLNISKKGNSPDWSKVIEGDEEEIRKMRIYNKQDVKVLEEVYLKLRKFDVNHPDLSLITPVRDIEGNIIHSCKICNSVHVIKNGKIYYPRSVRQRYLCKDCGYTFGGETLSTSARPK